MLSSVLLYVIDSPRCIDLPTYPGSFLQRRLGDVNHAPVIEVSNLDNRYFFIAFQHNQPSRIVHLSATCWIKSSAVQHDAVLIAACDAFFLASNWKRKES